MNMTMIGRLGLAAACLLAASAAASAHVKVRVGNVITVSDVGIYIADKKGYFKAEGLDVEFIPFNTAAKMIAPLGAGQLGRIDELLARLRLTILYLLVAVVLVSAVGGGTYFFLNRYFKRQTTRF